VQSRDRLNYAAGQVALDQPLTLFFRKCEVAPDQQVGCSVLHRSLGDCSRVASMAHCSTKCDYMAACFTEQFVFRVRIPGKVVKCTRMRALSRAAGGSCLLGVGLIIVHLHVHETVSSVLLLACRMQVAQQRLKHYQQQLLLVVMQHLSLSRFTCHMQAAAAAVQMP
jgi:hypothetical protein